MPDDDLRFEESGDELRDDEFPDEDEFDDDLSPVAPCPQCGAEVYEDAVQCPICGTYITDHGNLWTGRPLWWIVLGLLGAVATVLALAGYFSR